MFWFLEKFLIIFINQDVVRMYLSDITYYTTTNATVSNGIYKIRNKYKNRKVLLNFIKKFNGLHLNNSVFFHLPGSNRVRVVVAL